MKKIFILLIGLVFAACQPSPIQEFFAEKQEDPTFNSLVLPASLLGIAQDSLNEEQRAAVNSLEKVHFVWQQVDS